MKDQLKTLAGIFTDQIFRIPDYQRGYAWTSQQLSEFWDDLISIKENQNHYTGVITLEAVKPEQASRWDDDYWIIQDKGFKPFYIVDGQQRLTTCLILIQSIVDLLPKDSTLVSHSREEIRTRYICQQQAGGHSKAFIFGYEKDNPSHDHLKTVIFGETSPTDRSEPQTETVYTQNLDSAKEFFTEQIKNKTKPELEALFKTLTQSLLFNTFDFANNVDVHISFETMNNRGKKLSCLELLKNRLIYLTASTDESPHEKETLRKSINECWKSVYHVLGRDKNNPLSDDEFLKAHHFLHFASENLANNTNSNESPTIELNKTIKTCMQYEHEKYEDSLLKNTFIKSRMQEITYSYIHKYVESLRKGANIWYQINRPTDLKIFIHEEVRNWLIKIHRLSNHVSPENGRRGYYFGPSISTYKVNIFIMAFFYHEKDVRKQLELLKNLERYIFILSCFSSEIYPKVSINTKDAIDLEQLINLSGLYLTTTSAMILSKHISTDDIIKSLASATSLQFDIQDDQPNFTARQITGKNAKNSSSHIFALEHLDGDFYNNWKPLRYFLFEYEEDLKRKTKNNTSKIMWEEIIKQYKDSKTVEHIYPQTPRHAYWQSRFNSNIKAKDKRRLRNSLGNLLPISNPKNASLQNKPFNEKKGSRQNKVGYKYGCYSEIEVSEYNEWTPQNIKQRGIELLKFMESRWNLKLGTDADKVKLLGLEFLP